MTNEIFCSEAWARFDPAQVARHGAGSYALARELADARLRATVCRYLPHGVVPAHDGAAVRTTTPVLWLTGDGDPQDPAANLREVPAQQPHSRVVVMPAQQHVVGPLGCMPQVSGPSWTPAAPTTSTPLVRRAARRPHRSGCASSTAMWRVSVRGGRALRVRVSRVQWFTASPPDAGRESGSIHVSSSVLSSPISIADDGAMDDSASSPRSGGAVASTVVHPGPEARAPGRLRGGV